jgi:hypothetical protein
MGKITYYFKRKIGNEYHSFSTEGENLNEVVLNSKKLSFGDITSCGMCGSADLELSAHIAQDKYHYTYIRCKSCKATLNFGQQQKDKDIFYLRTVEQNNNGNIYKVYDWKPFNTNEQ